MLVAAERFLTLGVYDYLKVIDTATHFHDPLLDQTFGKETSAKFDSFFEFFLG